MADKLFYGSLAVVFILGAWLIVHTLRVERQRNLICWRSGYYDRVFIAEHCYCVDIGEGRIVPFENVGQ